MTDHIDELRKQCLIGARLMWQELRDPYGHVSCRLPDNSGFLIKMVRVPPAPIDPDQVMTFDFEGNCLDGDQEIWEVYIHSEILKRRPDIQSVIHTHPHVATAISATGKSVFAITQQSAQFGEGLPVFKGDWIDTRELGAELAEFLQDQPGALLKGHGSVVVGRSVPHAVETALYVEQAAKQLLWASALGTPEVLPERVRNHPRRLAFTRAPGGGSGGNLWRQLLWEMDRRDATSHPSNI